MVCYISSVVKECPDDLIDEKDLMEAQTLIVEEDASLGSVDEQNVDLSNSDTLLDAAADDDDLQQYQFRSNEGGKLVTGKEYIDLRTIL